MTDLGYGAVYVSGGRFKGHIMYYDDDEGSRTAICYAGHPIDHVGCFGVQPRFLREPSIDDLLQRRDKIWRKLFKYASDDEWPLDPMEIHQLWSEKALIDDILYERRMLAEMKQIATEKTVFLCHSSSDKGFVRMVNDDLVRLGAQTWIDENNVVVGDSIVGKIEEGLKSCQFMAVFLSPESVKSMWTKREWQSFLARQLSGSLITVLPVLVKECEIPSILSDLKYANFTKSYHDGLKDLRKGIG